MTAQQDFLIDIFELSSNDLAYFAGLFDGEGTIGLQQHLQACSFTLALAMTDAKAINGLHDAFGGTLRMRTYSNPKWNTLYEWYVGGKRAELILRTLLPFLRVRREEADLALRLRHYNHRKGFGTARKRLADEILAIRHKKAV